MPDRALSGVEKENNKRVPANQPERLIKPRESLTFLVARDNLAKRFGFVEIELELGETVRDAIRRQFPWSDVGLKRPWKQIGQFSHREWDVSVGFVEVTQDQRFANLAEQLPDLPYSLEWQKPDWLFRQRASAFLNEITTSALKQDFVQEFFQASQHRKAA
ncbi:MAG: hypothetical protein WDN67_03150 [Candidatus Moraniibacteriota bacterium]